MSEKNNTKIQIYGYTILCKNDDGIWSTPTCEEYSCLPSHYLFIEEAQDRVDFLRGKGIECRYVMLVVDPSDEASAFEEARIYDKE
tara:strand:+ start:798 stop:1055 length:258 start_codon:yes stop_codon:yes gene_type:complete